MLMLKTDLLTNKPTNFLRSYDEDVILVYQIDSGQNVNQNTNIKITSEITCS